VTNYLTGTVINPGTATISVTGAGLTDPNTLNVTVTYPYKFFAPGILGLGTTITLTAKTVMRQE